MTYKFSSDIRQSYAYVVPGKFKGSYDSNRKYLENSIKTAFAFISNCKCPHLHGMRESKKHIDVDIYSKYEKPYKPNCFS